MLPDAGAVLDTTIAGSYWGQHTHWGDLCEAGNSRTLAMIAQAIEKGECVLRGRFGGENLRESGVKGQKAEVNSRLRSQMLCDTMDGILR